MAQAERLSVTAQTGHPLMPTMRAASSHPATRKRRAMTAARLGAMAFDVQKEGVLF